MAHLVAVAPLLCIAAFGCGYRLVGADSTLASVRSVAIDTPRNNSFQPGVEYLVADSLRRELLRRGVAELDENPQAADLVVSGAVVSVETGPRSFSSVFFVLENQVTLALQLDAKRSDGTVVALDPRALHESELYLSSADVQAERKNREEALRRLSDLLAERFFDAVAEELVP